MGKRGLNGAVLGLLLLAGWTLHAAPPNEVIHQPPEQAVIGQPLPMHVELAGDVDPDATWVTLHYRPQGSKSFISERMRSVGGGRFEASVPETGTRSLSLSYYIELSGNDDSWSFGIGSAERPLKLSLSEPDGAVSSTTLLKLGVTFGLVAAAALLFLLRERLVRRSIKERVFWAKVLLPVSGARGPRLSEEIGKLSRRPLRHPRLGVRRFRRDVLLQKLREVRSWDLSQLADDYMRHVGKPLELPRVGGAEGMEDAGPAGQRSFRVLDGGRAQTAGEGSLSTDEQGGSEGQPTGSSV